MTEYDTSTTFIKRLEVDLRTLIERRLQQRVSAVAGAGQGGETEGSAPPPLAPPYSGPPYPGLRPFTTEEAPIFFGREREVDGLIARLRDPAQCSSP